MVGINVFMREEVPEEKERNNAEEWPIEEGTFENFLARIQSYILAFKLRKLTAPPSNNSPKKKLYKGTV